MIPHHLQMQIQNVFTTKQKAIVCFRHFRTKLVIQDTPTQATAGFIGFYTSQYLLDRGDTVIGNDNLNNYYDPSLKEARLYQLNYNDRFSFLKIDIIDKNAIDNIFKSESPGYTIHLATQAASGNKRHRGPRLALFTLKC